MNAIQDLLELVADDEITASALRDLMEFEVHEWVTVFRNATTERTDDYRLACLLKAGVEASALLEPRFDLLSDHGRPGFVGTGDGNGGWNVEYLTVGSEEVVPLVFHRYSPGNAPEVVELAEDFRLFWDLFEEPDHGRFVCLTETGDLEVAAQRVDGELQIKKRFLRRYQAARQLSLSLQIEVTVRGGDEIEHRTGIAEDIADSQYRLAYYGGSGLSVPDFNFTRLLGKRVLPPPPIESCGVWPYEADRDFASFIIGTDPEGVPEEHTADPDQLANYFGKNPDSPHYLTPVFFERSVLDRYYRDTDRYQVEDAYLRASGAWGLRMDNALNAHVAVFLGDLGSDLPYLEQQHWRVHNVTPPGPMSETAIRRSFLGEWADTSRVESRFLGSYTNANERWEQSHGWPLFIALHDADLHVSTGLHIPTNASFGQFDEQIIRLAKLTVDSLNESQLEAAIVGKVEKGAKGIRKLELLLTQETMDDHGLCDLMRRVQGARTRSSAHRKSSEFDIQLLLNGSKDLPDLFATLLGEFIACFDALGVAADQGA